MAHLLTAPKKIHTTRFDIKQMEWNEKSDYKLILEALHEQLKVIVSVLCKSIRISFKKFIYSE